MEPEVSVYTDIYTWCSNSLYIFGKFCAAVKQEVILQKTWLSDDGSTGILFWLYFIVFLDLSIKSFNHKSKTTMLWFYKALHLAKNKIKLIIMITTLLKLPCLSCWRNESYTAISFTFCTVSSTCSALEDVFFEKVIVSPFIQQKKSYQKKVITKT